MATDQDVVRRVLAGDTEAFRVLVERHADRLHGVLVRLLADPQAAAEVAQDTLVKAYRRLASYRGEASFGTWLIQIGVHEARDRHRRTQRRGDAGIVSLEAVRGENPHGWEAAAARDRADPLDHAQTAEAWRLLEEELCGLPPAFREVFTLRHLEELDYPDIARITGDSIGTLKVRVHRARLLLRERMRARGYQPDAAGPARDGPPVRRRKGS
jgi:RNA polymerase sigma-70 factor (ECF subfamily)